jgi:hypothetical protein
VNGVNGSGDDFPSTHVFGAVRGEPVHDGHTGELPAVYDALTPDTLNTEWDLAHPPAGEHTIEPPPVWDQQVLMALGIIGDLVQRGREPKEIVNRAAVALLHDPGKPGTPLRCTNCSRVYLAGDGPCDWRMAGRADGMCWDCTLAAPKHAAKPAPAAVKPKAPAPPGTTRRQRPSRARKAAINRDTS